MTPNVKINVRGAGFHRVQPPLDAPDPGPAARLLGFALDAALLLIALAAASAMLVTGVAHLDDPFMLEHVAGAWLGLADAAREGVLYPPFFAGEAYGGTRNMPLSILLHAGLAGLVGDLLVSGKLLNLLASSGLSAAILLGTAGTGLRLPQRLFLAFAIFLAYPGVLAAASIRNDALPALLQLAAVLLFDRRPGVRQAVVAGILCALATLAKVTALWGPAAIGLWLLLFDRRMLVAFVAAYLLPLAAMLAAVEVASDGRMLENLLGLTLPASLSFSEIAPNLRRFVVDFTERALLAWALVPIAGLAIAAALIERRPPALHFALVFSLALTLVAYTDPGAWSNHLIDLVVLVPLAAAGWWAVAGRGASLALSALALFMAATAVVTGGTAITAAASLLGPERPRDPVAEWVSPGETLLSQDPYIPVIRGETPIVRDPFMLKRLQDARPDLVEPLVQRIRDRDFGRIVLLVRPEDSTAYMRHAHFGEPVWEAIAANYALVAADVGGKYQIYGPRP